MSEATNEVKCELKAGTVKWFNDQKAYGFISLPEGGMDIFVHANELRKSGIARFLKEGEQVKFRVSAGDKGQYAIDISVVPVSGDNHG